MSNGVTSAVEIRKLQVLTAVNCDGFSVISEC